MRGENTEVLLTNYLELLSTSISGTTLHGCDLEVE